MLGAPSSGRDRLRDVHLHRSDGVFDSFVMLVVIVLVTFLTADLSAVP